MYYNRLYEHWWGSSAQIQRRPAPSVAVPSPADKVEDKLVNGGVLESTRTSDKLDFDASLLLSECHAAYQATQRSVREVQEKLSAMVQQHCGVQEGQLNSEGEKENATTEMSDIQGSVDAEQW